MKTTVMFPVQHTTLAILLSVIQAICLLCVEKLCKLCSCMFYLCDTD